LQRKHLNEEDDKEDEALVLVRALFSSNRDMESNKRADTSIIKIHSMATSERDKAVGLLLSDLTEKCVCLSSWVL